MPFCGSPAYQIYFNFAFRRDNYTKSKMNDNDLRGVVLQKYYEKRREGWIQWKAEDFQNVETDFTPTDLFSVCDQLGEHGLIDWKGLEDNGGVTIDGRGKITAYGI